MGGMIFVDAIRGVGVVFLMTVGIFRNMDPSLEEAAMVAGASPRRVARLITLKLMMPGILAAFVYSLTGALETFEVPAIMGLPGNIHLLSTKILPAEQDRRPGHRQRDRHRLHPVRRARSSTSTAG